MTFVCTKYKLCLHKSFGWLAERSNATVLKTADGATRPGVRIPHHPPQKTKHPKGCLIFCPVWFGMKNTRNGGSTRRRKADVNMPVRAANKPREARAKRMANPSPSATKRKHAKQACFFVFLKKTKNHF